VIAAVDVGTLNRAILLVRNAHLRPVDMAALNINNDPVRNAMTAGDKYLDVASIRVDGEQAATACVDEVHATTLVGRHLGVVWCR
jgi:hypothetical protein